MSHCFGVKVLTAVTFLFASCICSAAETVRSLKSKISAACEVYFGEQNIFCKDVSDELNRNGFSNYSTYVCECAGKTFGSGFIYG